MLNAIYPYDADAEFRVFEFDSIGPKGVIRKVIQYTETNLYNFYNLGFGDKDATTNDLDDRVITNNNDGQKVLATVAATLLVFTEYHPEAFVLATGSTLSRTRLYRIGINNNLKDIEIDFYVFGLRNGKWQTFERNVTYEAFLVKRKT